MSSNKDILSNFAESILPEVKKVAGRFSDSISYEADENVLVIYGSPYISVLWKGRKPTSAGAKKGNPTLFQIIRKWVDKVGIVPYADQFGRTPSRDGLAWVITRSIHERGTLLYRNGGKPNPFNEVFKDNLINKLLSLLSNKYFEEVKLLD